MAGGVKCPGFPIRRVEAPLTRVGASSSSAAEHPDHAGAIPPR